MFLYNGEYSASGQKVSGLCWFADVQHFICRE